MNMKLKNLSILVTGGAGFIGSHTAITLAKTNSVTVLDTFDSAVRTPAALKKAGITVVKGSVLDQKTIDRTVKKADVIIHMAVACVRLSLNHPMEVHHVNVTGALNLLMAAQKHNTKRIVLISSSEAYGSASHGLIGEDHDMDPVTVYGMSKYMSDLYGRLYYRHMQQPVVTVRPFNTYGPYSHFDGVYGEVIPRFVIRALAGKQATVYGDGSQSRDFTYITDTVNGVIAAAEADSLIGQTINIARGQEVSVKKIAEIICKHTGLPFEPIMLPSRPNDVMRHAADTKKAKKLLGYSPEVSIDEGLKQYIDWVKTTYPDTSKLLKFIPKTNW